MCVKFKTLNVTEITHKPTYTVTEDLTLLANVFEYCRTRVAIESIKLQKILKQEQIVFQNLH